jgi:hypothetical protein
MPRDSAVNPLKPQDCPYWENCGAPICPLQPCDVHIEGEPICVYLADAAKLRAGQQDVPTAAYRGGPTDPILVQAVMMLPQLEERAGTAFRKQIKRAARSGSRRARTARINGRRGGGEAG